MQCVLMRFDAPLMSFGGVLVDQHNPTEPFPARSMLTGLVGNALGYAHRDAVLLDELQTRITFAARWDVEPQFLRDYHTADLGQSHLARAGWTTRGITEHRGGGSAKTGTHQRLRYYWANGVLTVALSVGEGSPDAEAIAGALEMPARPLFLGRKTCLPACRILLGVREARSVLAALRGEPLSERGEPQQSLRACWPPSCGLEGADPRQQIRTADLRAWGAQVHVGGSELVVGTLQGIPPCT